MARGRRRIDAITFDPCSSVEVVSAAAEQPRR